MVVISTSNKYNVWCWKDHNDDYVFGDIVDASKKHPKKEMISVGLSKFARGVLKHDEFFGDTVDTLKEDIEQH